MTENSGVGEPARKFGTFLGVYTPSVLTILGLIMYLRFGWVVGNAGLPLTLFIVLLATSITAITALSASAVANSGPTTDTLVSASCPPLLGAEWAERTWSPRS